MRSRGRSLLLWLVLSLVALGAVDSALAASPQLVTLRNPSVAQPVGGNGDSVAPTITPDGHFVVFTSTANNLVPGDNSYLRSDVFVRDLWSNTTTLVSVNYTGTGGGNNNSSGALISTNGRYVVFESDATDLVPGDTNGATDIFQRDLQAGTTTLISVATNGSVGNGASTYPVMTPDGRYVAFLSFATNLIANDTNGIQDVFERDTVAGTTALVSAGATGPLTIYQTNMDTPVISADGRYVGFYSLATGLAPVPIQTGGDIYIRDMASSLTACPSTNLFIQNLGNEYSYTNWLNGSWSMHPAVSGDGHILGFRHFFNTGGSGNLNCFVYDTIAQTDTLLVQSGHSTNTPQNSVLGPALANDDTYGPEVTPDGRFAAYVASDSNLHVWDNQLATDVVASLDISNNLTSGLSYAPVFSANGRFLVFLSTSTNLVTNTISPGAHFYFRDLQASNTTLVDVDTDGAGSIDMTGSYPSVSSNGQFVAFCAPDGSLVSGDTNGHYDVFVRDMTNGVTQLISVPSTSIAPLTANGMDIMFQYALSADGRWLVYSSRSSDLVTNDFNGSQDVFVADLQTGSNALVSVGLDGNSALGGDSGSPCISADGRYVAFVSMATNLVAAYVSNSANNIFLRDLQTGFTSIVNVTSDGAVLGPGDAALPVISTNGRYVAFLARTNVGQAAVVYWRDTSLGQTVSLNAATSVSPLLSADGRYVAYLDNVLHLWVWDSVLSTIIYSNITAATTSFALSPAGDQMLYQATGQVVAASLTNGSNLFSFTSAVRIKSPAVWSADERYIAFVTAAAATPNDTNAANDVYLCDLQTGTVTLISANYAGSASGNNASDSPALSSDGRFVIFRSFATDIVPGITSTPNIFVFDRLTGSNTLLSAQQPGSGSWSSWISSPAISANGGMVAFQSYSSLLLPSEVDLNFVQDVFSEAQSPWPTNDSVGDGIPDAWRAYYFGGSGTTTNSQSCATCDPDGDGMSNLQEYLAGTDPTNPASVFRLQISAQGSTNNLVITWPAVAGRNYQLQYKTNLTDVVWQTPSATRVVGDTGYYQATNSPPSGYYRVVILN
jgi:Bacterial TSP3 repeat/WD40-like Beta Propeller Repeat